MKIISLPMALTVMITMALLIVLVTTTTLTLAMMIIEMQEAKKRPGLFETEDWARMESSYPKLASLVLNRAISDCS